MCFKCPHLWNTAPSSFQIAKLLLFVNVYNLSIRVAVFPGLNKLVRSDIFNKFNLHNKANKCAYAECVLSNTVLHQHVSFTVVTVIRVTYRNIRNTNSLSKCFNWTSWCYKECPTIWVTYNNIRNLHSLSKYASEPVSFTKDVLIVEHSLLHWVANLYILTDCLDS
jgi:hypothetical protein